MNQALALYFIASRRIIMSACTSELIIAEYRFTFTARDPLTLPVFSDPLRRSVFGLALHQQSCIAPNADCADCMLRHQCDFAFFIKGPRPPEAKMMRKVGTVPLPHIFHSDQCGEASILPGGQFTHGLVLAGAACQRLPAVIRAMEQSGRLGLLEPGKGGVGPGQSAGARWPAADLGSAGRGSGQYYGASSGAACARSSAAALPHPLPALGQVLPSGDP